jgi:uncharacterized protein YjbJ (UPF0337 family)
MANQNRDDSVREEIGGLGQEAKGHIKEGLGNLTGDRSLERSGERDQAIGDARAESNDVLAESDGVRAGTAGAPAYGDRYKGRLVTGLYRTPDEAQRAYDELTTRHGYRNDDVSVLMTDDTRKRYYGDAKPGTELDKDGDGNKALEGLGVGSAIGGTLGAVIAAIAAVGSNLVLPGLGLVVAGPLAAAFAGAGAGGATGGLLGALIGSGIPEDRAKEYETGLQEGGIVLGTHARDDAHAVELERDYQTWGGRDVVR